MSVEATTNISQKHITGTFLQMVLFYVYERITQKIVPIKLFLTEPKQVHFFIFQHVCADLMLAVLLGTCMCASGQFVTSLLFQIVKRLSRVYSHPPDKRGSSAQLPHWHPWSLLLPPDSRSKDKCSSRGNSAQWMKA